MRTAFALTLATLLLSMPATLAGAPATFTQSDVCLAGGTYVLGAAVGLPGCSVTHEGTVAPLACEGIVCSFEVTVEAHLRGAPAGHRSLATTADDSFAPGFLATICSAESVAAFGDVSCLATGIATIELTDQCRFFVVETNAAVNARMGATRLVSTFRACIVDGAPVVEAA